MKKYLAPLQFGATGFCLSGAFACSLSDDWGFVILNLALAAVNLSLGIYNYAEFEAQIMHSRGNG